MVAITYANNEEHSSEHRRRHGTQNGQEWSCHGAPDCHAHEEVTDSLLNNSCSLDLGFANLISVHGLYSLEACLIYRQGICMYGRLRNEAVRKWKPNDAGHEASATEKEEVPMETCGLLEGVLPCLRGQRRYVL